MQNRQPAWKKNKDNSKVGPLEVVVRDNDINQALKVLKHKMSIEGVLTELKKRRKRSRQQQQNRNK
jgi:ribosomal protein S21